MNSTISDSFGQRVSAGLAVLRIVLGVVFIAHGAQKLFVMGLAGTTAFFTQAGIPLPAVTAPLVAVLEFFGGMALILGLFTRLAALGLAINMLGAIVLVRASGGFFAPQGAEFEITLCAASVALALTGAGAFSLDAMLARRRSVAGTSAPTV
ncbi:MAG: DoxX family protein [Gemmatimonadaceae bacterium]